jgi:hypothetical protein
MINNTFISISYVNHIGILKSKFTNGRLFHVWINSNYYFKNYIQIGIGSTSEFLLYNTKNHFIIPIFIGGQESDYSL